jgi:hypothetical protein
MNNVSNAMQAKQSAQAAASVMIERLHYYDRRNQ